MKLDVSQLNFQHLLYFWHAVREGSATAAAKKLRLSQSTVSAQIGLLQDAVGAKLLERVGRTMVLTEAGKAVFRYADEVFPHGQELLDELRGAPPRGGGRLTVGIGDGVPKLEARRLLLPALSQAEAPILVCVQDHVAALVAKLLTFELDLVLADEPVSAEGGPALVSRLLSSGDVSFFGAPGLLGALTGPFPTCLQSAPLLLPGNRTALRWELQRWLDALHLVPRIVAEIEDSALMKAMGQAGAGLFVAPSTLRAVVETSYGVGVVGRASGLRSSVYALTVERRRPHPAVAALLAAL